MIFFSHFINLGGALFLKSIELTIITDKLLLPLSSIVYLALFNFLIIISHTIYRKINPPHKLKNFIGSFLNKFGFFEINKISILYIVSIVAIFSRIFYLNLNTPIISQITAGVSGPNLFQDILAGFSYLFFLPVIIFFYDNLYGVEKNKYQKIFFIIFIMSAIFVSVSRGSRSTFFDVVLLTLIIFFIQFLFNKFNIGKNFFIKFMFILIVFLPTLNFFENLSNKFLNQKSNLIERSPIENLSFFFSNIFDDQISYDAKQQIIESNSKALFGENYYNNLIFNRINILMIHDNFNYIKPLLNKTQITNTKNLQINKIISILPQPIINIFSNNFNKANYNNLSTASYLYGSVDVMMGNKSIGSALMTLYIIFEGWTFLLLLIFFIPFFIIFDSFYNRELKIFSPFILIFFYSTGLGILNFLSASDISVWFTFLRTLPETLLFIFIINFIFKSFFKTGNT
jgi:hypothetical protein|tara:strand:- start:521 stop:1891 length:1371 start_codon:yes stop_codon:yes gene_type:complete